MAHFLPSLEEIKKATKRAPTEGELALLEKLADLDDNHTVYFQPFLNGKAPDVIVLIKHYGIVIVEVKDYDLDIYKHTCNTKEQHDFGVFQVRDNKSTSKKYIDIDNPFQQASNYKDILFDLLPLLENKKLINDLNYGLIKSFVYFHKASLEKLESFVEFSAPRHKVLQFKYIYMFGNDSDFVGDIAEVFSHKVIDDELNNHIRLILQPSVERMEQDQIPTLSKQQLELSQSVVGAHKIKGVAGSGKSLVLAKRALNAVENGDRVLVLTFNITLTHHISDDISKFQSYQKNNIHVINFHRFMYMIHDLINPSYLKSFEDIKDIEDVEDSENSKNNKELEYITYVIENFHKSNNCSNFKYNTILIDEVQDFKLDWLVFLEENILIKDKLWKKDGKEIPFGEYVLFGDEKQNIYTEGDNIFSTDLKELDEIFDGEWNELKECYRMQPALLDLALKFQETFMPNNCERDYDVASHEIASSRNGFLGYYHFVGDFSQKGSNSENVDFIYDTITKVQKDLFVSSNDIAVIYDKIFVLKDLEDRFGKDGINSTTTFESNKEFLELKQSLNIDNKYKFGDNGYEIINPDPNYNKDEDKVLKKFLYRFKKLGQNKKRAFYMNRGTVKISTIQSFKGWEIDTLFVILDQTEKSKDNNELLYTAITRCKTNLIIIDLGTNDKSEFFRNNINNKGEN